MSYRVLQLLWFLLAVCVGFSTSSPALADRAAVLTVLSEMEKAVLAADSPAYLTHVDRADPIFLKEQENWAADLKLHVPTTFALTIAEPDDEKSDIPKARFDDDAGRATFELVMEWTITVGGEDQGGRAVKEYSRNVSFPAVFVRRDGKWLYAGEDWVTVKSGGQAAAATTSDPAPAPSPSPTAAGADATTPSDTPAVPLSNAPNSCRFFAGFEDTAESVVAVLPEVRAHVDAGFENPVAHEQEVKVYPTMRHLQASIYLSYVDSLSGWNEPGESIKLLASRRSNRDGLRQLLAHEYGHVATFELGPRANDIPWWVLEGVAELSAERFVVRRAGRGDDDAGGPTPTGRGEDADAVVRRWSDSDRLVAWNDLTDFRKVSPSHMRNVYKQGQHMLGYISERFGRTKRNAWLRAMAQGASLDDATKSALGRTFAELDSQWHADLKQPSDSNSP